MFHELARALLRSLSLCGSIRGQQIIDFRLKRFWNETAHGAGGCDSSYRSDKLLYFKLGSYLSLYFLDLYSVLFWFNPATVGVCVNLGKFCTEEENLSGIINPQQQSNQ